MDEDSFHPLSLISITWNFNVIRETKKELGRDGLKLRLIESGLNEKYIDSILTQFERE